MRVSTSLIFNTGTQGILDRQADLYRMQNQLATGRRIQTPADDPIGSAQALEVTQAKEVNQQYLDNQGNARAKLSLLDSTLGGINEELQKIYERGIQAGNGSYGDAERGAIAAELKQRMQSLIGLANTQDGNGLYIFSGFKSTTQPFQGAAATYQGDSGNEALQVSSSRVMNTTENGMDVFVRVRDESGAVTGRTAFEGLQNMIDILDGSTPYSTALYSQALGDLSSSLTHVSTVRSSVGARLQALDSMSSAAEDADLLHATRLSELQDLDYAEAITKLSRYQMQLEAAQLSFKQTSQLSLFNIL